LLPRCYTNWTKLRIIKAGIQYYRIYKKFDGKEKKNVDSMPIYDIKYQPKEKGA